MSTNETPISPLKKLLDETSQKVNEATQQVIKNIETTSPFASSKQQIFDVSFEDKKLGLTLQRGVFSGRPVVVAVEKSSTAATKGILVGDEITTIAGGPRSGFPSTPIQIDSYDKFMKLFPKHNRPVIMRFYRPPKGTKPSFIKQTYVSPNQSQGGNIENNVQDKLRDLLSSNNRKKKNDLEDVELHSGGSSDHRAGLSTATSSGGSKSNTVSRKKDDIDVVDDGEGNDEEDNEVSTLQSGGEGGGGLVGLNNLLKGKSSEEIKEEIKEKALQAADALKKQGKEIEDKFYHVKDKFSFWIEKAKENIETGEWRTQFTNDDSSSSGGVYRDYNQTWEDEEEKQRKLERKFEDNEEYEMQRIKEQAKRQWKNMTLEHLERFVVSRPKVSQEDNEEEK
jgi:hypothetical protein